MECGGVWWSVVECGGVSLAPPPPVALCPLALVLCGCVGIIKRVLTVGVNLCRMVLFCGEVGWFDGARCEWKECCSNVCTEAIGKCLFEFFFFLAIPSLPLRTFTFILFIIELFRTASETRVGGLK